MDVPNSDPQWQPRRSQRLRSRTPISYNKEATSTAPERAEVAAPIASQGQDEEILDDDLCPICHTLLYRPVITTCRHTMCEACMVHWADVSVVTQMTIVDVDEVPVAFDPVSELEAKCPMCRTQTRATRDRAREEALRRVYPRTWEGLRFDDGEADRGLGGVETLTVYVGNRHQLVPVEEEDRLEGGKVNEHQWTFFLKPSRTDIIAEVRLLLHETFHPSTITRKRPPYSFQASGWGTFELTACVVLKAGNCWVSSDAVQAVDNGTDRRMLPLEWMLDFEGFGGKGSMGRLRLKVRREG